MYILIMDPTYQGGSTSENEAVYEAEITSANYLVMIFIYLVLKEIINYIHIQLVNTGFFFWPIWFK